MSMHQPTTDSASEVKRLQRCMNDLVSVLALPAVWSGSEPSQILAIFLDAIMEILDLDFLYARARIDSSGDVIEVFRAASNYRVRHSEHQIRLALNQWLVTEARQWTEDACVTIAGQQIRALPMQMGLAGEVGLVVAASERIGFPGQTEKLILSVAANETALALHQALLLREQRRVSIDLERRVSVRTAELAIANEVLRKEILERKRAEEALRNRELNLLQITETIPEMLWSASPDGAIEYCNGRLLDYTGFNLDQILTNGWMELLHPDDLETTVDIWKSCVKSGAPYRVEVRTIHAADHAYRWCVTSALPLLDPEGRIVKWHGTVVDMHDWKQAQEQLRNTQEELARMMRVMTIGQLTASIAHEVSQPLSGIITNASTCLRMLNSNPPNVDGARETAQRTIRDGNRASDVITRLRTLFSNKQIIIEPVDMNEAAREVLALVSGELQKRDSLLLHQFSSDLPPVLGDRVQLQQVILNLLRNGSDAMETVVDRPRQLVIRTESDNNCVRVSVQDSGVGFDPEITGRLFESFFTTKQDGMGIGLSVSRSIVEAHHGKLWATRNDGPGATFAFSIPCDDALARSESN
jgi:PAS domain S-box-containing protein